MIKTLQGIVNEKLYYVRKSSDQYEEAKNILEAFDKSDKFLLTLSNFLEKKCLFQVHTKDKLKTITMIS